MFNPELGRAFYHDMLFGNRTGKQSQVLRTVYDKNLKTQPAGRQIEDLQNKVAQLEKQLKDKE